MLISELGYRPPSFSRPLEPRVVVRVGAAAAALGKSFIGKEGKKVPRAFLACVGPDDIDCQVFVTKRVSAQMRRHDGKADDGPLPD
jgi:hypothetical protein